MKNNILETKFFRKYFTILKYFSIFGLSLFLTQSFYYANIEPAFWIMGISTALASLIATKSNNRLKKNISKFIFATVSLTMAISLGGIFILFGGNISGYDVFSEFFIIEYGGTALLWGYFGLVSALTLLGVFEFIEGIYELFVVQGNV